MDTSTYPAIITFLLLERKEAEISVKKPINAIAPALILTALYLKSKAGSIVPSTLARFRRQA